MRYGTFQAIVAAVGIISAIIAVGTGVAAATSPHDAMPDPGVPRQPPQAMDPLAVERRAAPSHVVRKTVEVRVHSREHRPFLNTVVQDALEHGATRAQAETANLRYSTVNITAPGDYAERLRPLLAPEDENGFTSNYREWPPKRQERGGGPPTAMSVRVKIHFLHTRAQRNAMTGSVSTAAAAVLVMLLAAIAADSMRTPSEKRDAGEDATGREDTRTTETARRSTTE